MPHTKKPRFALKIVLPTLYLMTGMKTVFSWRSLALALCILGFSRIAPAVEDESAYSASISFGEERDEAAWKMTTSGDVRADILETESGGYHETHRVLTVSGKGSTVEFSVPCPPKGRPLLLEIQEIHNRRPKAFGYTILVNGKEVYFRTYEELGAGPNHFFVQVGPELLDGSEEARILIRNEGSTPFSLGHIWAYDDFFTHVAVLEKVYRPMGILGGVLPQADPKPVFTCFSPIGKLSIAQYGAGNVAREREKLIKDLRDGAQAGEMTMWMPNSTLWGGKPNGPDGLGGYFSDPRYSSIGFNPDTGRYAPSWPSMWGNSASPSLREKRMSQFNETRFRKLLGGVSQEIDFLRARGTAPNLVVVREWGASCCEISQSTIESAKADGIILDAMDGLSPSERRWMFRDGVDLWRDYAKSTRAVFERESVQVDQGKVTLPATQVLDNLYSQPDFLSDWPVGQDVWSMGEQGMVPGLWGSGELGQGKEYRELAMYDYLRARGRLSMVNMERTILKEDFGVLKKHYSRGFQFVTLFNDAKGDEKFIRAVDNCDNDAALPVVHREPGILSLDFCMQKTLGPEGAVVSADNVHIAHQNTVKIQEHRAPRLSLVDNSKPGEITYRLSNAGKPFAAGQSLHLDGRISNEPGNFIDIFAGESPESLQKLRTLTGKDLPCPDHWTLHVTSEASVDLGSAMVGKTDWYVRIGLNSPSASDAAFLLKAAVCSQWPQRSGYVNGNPLNLRQDRTLQLWVQDRALAANILDEYALTALANIDQPQPADRKEAAALLQAQADVLPREVQMYQRAADLFGLGWYRSAYEILSGDISQILPARYAVRGGGRLGCYPVDVNLPAADSIAVIKLHAVGKERVEFSLSSDADKQPIRLAFPGLDASSAAWAMEVLGPNHYALSHSPKSGVPVSLVNGQVTADLEILGRRQPAARNLPKTLVGRYLGGNKNRITIDTQDLEAMGFENSLDLVLAKEVVIERKPDRLEDPTNAKENWPKPLDKVSLKLDDEDQVIRIDAAYGRDRGRIKAFHPPVLLGELSPGGIELENGNRYDFSYAGVGGTTFNTVALHAHIANYEFPALEKALKPGDEIELTYCPYTTGGAHPRLGHVTEPFKVLLEEDFIETKGDEWKSKAVSIDGVAVVPHKPEPNYLYNVIVRLLRPTRYFQPGSVIYQVKSDRPLGKTALEFAARAFEDSGRVEFLTSLDGKEWTKAGQFDNTWQNNYPQSTDSKTWKFPPQVVDLTPTVKGLKIFFLKIQLSAGDADDRFCFGRFRVLTAENP